MDYLAGNLKFLREFISLRIPSIRVVAPQATYLVWLDCQRLNMNDEQLKSFMINEAGLGMNDGPQFGAEGAGFQRINIGCPRETLHQALLKLSAAIEKYFNK
jgi:cystathionine beta-lyase